MYILYGNSCTLAHDLRLHIAATNEPKKSSRSQAGKKHNKTG